MELMIPWILSYILDYVVPQKNTRLVLFWGLLMVLSAIAALVGNILANRISASVARDTTRTLRHDLFKKISYLSSAQIDYFSIPSLEARLTTDSYNINQVIGMMQRLGIRADSVDRWNCHYHDTGTSTDLDHDLGTAIYCIGCLAGIAQRYSNVYRFAARSRYHGAYRT